MSRQIFEQVSVLVVDDNRHMVHLVCQVLHALGVKRTIPALDGAEAFTQMRTNAIDIVVADYNMSPIDGIEFVKLLRTANDSPNPYVPIVMLTGRTDYRSVRAARDSGITEFLAKPISAKGLYLRLLNLIENPRPFIRARNYFGPDRRRQDDPAYRGARRRESDATDPETLSASASG
jgi:two-component system, chemotaxis family, chemotaxis protein CheY